MKRRQKAGFLSPRSSKIIVTKEEERRKRKRKSDDEERRSRKKAMVALLVFRIATSEIVFGRKNYRTQKVHLEITLSKIRLDIYDKGENKIHETKIIKVRTYF